MRALRFWCAAASLALAGCSGDTTAPQDAGTIAVFGTLYIGKTIDEPGIRVSRVQPIEAPYDRDEAAVNDALVTIRREGAPAPDTLRLARPGEYVGSGFSIAARTTYHLRVVVPGGPEITATTTTPDSFSASGGPPHGPVEYEALQDLYPILVRCENAKQILLVDAYCNEDWEDARYVNPFGSRNAPEDYDEYGGDNGPPRHISAYFRLDQIVRDGDAYVIDFYSAMMAYYGSYDVHVLSIDDNTYNYLYRDHPEENGGIEGGIGLFGSAERRVWTVVSVPNVVPDGLGAASLLSEPDR